MKRNLLIPLSVLLFSIRSRAATSPENVETPQAQAAAAALVKGAQEALAPQPESDEEPGEVTEEEAAKPPVKVSEGVYRSSRRDLAALRRLYDMGVRTIVNLEGRERHRDEVRALRRIEAERAAAGKPAWHIESENVPMSGILPPRFGSVDDALALLADSSKRPILVHCKHGEDRTGVIVSAFRVEIEKNMSIEDAAQEARSFHCCHLILPGEHALPLFLTLYRQSR